MNRQEENIFDPDEDLLSMIKRWDMAQSAVPPPEPSYLSPDEFQGFRAAMPPPEPSYLSPDELQGFQSAFAKAQEHSPPPPMPPKQSMSYSQVIEAADRAWIGPLTTPAAPHTAAPNMKQVKQMKKKRKRKRPVRKLLSWALALLLIITGALYLSAYAFAGLVDQGDSLSRASVTVPRMGVTNILIIGVDGEAVRGDGDGRSDTILLLSIDWLRGKLKLTSFLRDSWLPMPNGSYNRLNAAFHAGGVPALAQTVSANFSIRIDHYVQLNFTAFEVLVDALGGIAVPVTDAEANFLCRTTRLGKQIGRESMRQQMEARGAVKMTGEQALIYSRIRKLDNDFNRTQRQRKVFGIIASKALRSPVSLLFNISKALPYIKTDMSRARIAAFAAAAPLYLAFKIEEHYVPSDGSWQSANRGGASVITLDIARNTKELREFIYG